MPGGLTGRTPDSESGWWRFESSSGIVLPFWWHLSPLSHSLYFRDNYVGGAGVRNAIEMAHKLSAHLRYGTCTCGNGSPSRDDHDQMLALCRRIAADMGDAVTAVYADPTDTLSWPHVSLQLSYSLFDPDAPELNRLARVWAPKLEAAFGITTHINGCTN